MTFIDITLPIKTDLPVWPGDPKIALDWLSRINQGGEANVSIFEMSVHSGTHIDAPYHFIQKGATIDMIDLDVLIGRVVVVEVPTHFTSINFEYLKSLEISGCDRILFKTLNSSHWVKNDINFDKNYIGIEPEGANWLVEKNIRLVGIDYLSIAPFDCTVEPHRILLGAGIILIEGLNLANVNAGMYKLICLPLNLQGREGAPARVILETI